MLSLDIITKPCGSFKRYCIPPALISSQKSARRESIALWSATIFALYPDLIESAAMLLGETLYLFLWTLFIFAFVWYIDKTKPAESGFAGWLHTLSEWLGTRSVVESLRRGWPGVVGLGVIRGVKG